MSEKKITEKFNAISKDALKKNKSPAVDSFFANWDKRKKQDNIKIDESLTVREIKEKNPAASMAVLNWTRSLMGRKSVKKTREMRDKLNE